MDIYNLNIAIIHEWFLSNSFGGAEKVAIELDKYLTENFSKPDLFSLVEDISKSDENFLAGRKIKTSLIQKLPFGTKKIQQYLPLIPFAIEQLELNNYDLIISSSHLSAKGVLTSPEQLHISYVHTPMRYAWDQMNTYIRHSILTKFGMEFFLRYILFKMRKWDFLSGQRPDFLIANSNFTARRIKKYWGLKSEVIFPPVNVELFDFSQERENFYLSVNRLVPNKRVDLLVSTFNKLGLPLFIIGEGPEKEKLNKLANPNIKFLGKESNKNIIQLMSRCRAFVYAGIEDFGIAPVEAIASGAPVIALGKGGLLDTVNCLNNCSKNKIPTGILFKKQTESDITNAISWFEDNKIWKKFNSKDLNTFAQKFNTNNFNLKMGKFINLALEKFNKEDNIIF